MAKKKSSFADVVAFEVEGEMFCYDCATNKFQKSVEELAMEIANRGGVTHEGLEGDELHDATFTRENELNKKGAPPTCDKCGNEIA